MKGKRSFESRYAKSGGSAGFGTRAKDLHSLRDTVVEAAGLSSGLWLSYLFVLLYLTISVGGVTDKDLFLETPVKLPFLSVDLPLLGFFVIGPLLFVIVHAYTLLHFTLLADKVGAFHNELEAQIPRGDTRTRLRRQLPSNIFVQFLGGPADIRRGVVGWMLRLIALISLVAGPVVLLVFFVLQFLPYHSQWISWWQRILVVIDLALLWMLWPSIASGSRVVIYWRDLRRLKVACCLALSLLPVLLVFAIATYPDERLDYVFFHGMGLRGLLVGGEVDYIRQRPQSLWSNVLVLPGFDPIDHAKFDSDAKFEAVFSTLSLRGRNLDGAILIDANLRKVDFTGASFVNADLSRAQLRDAIFACVTLGSDLCSSLRGARLLDAELRGADLEGAQLQGADLRGAQLQGAHLDFASLVGANLGAQLQGASLDDANLIAADLSGAQLQGASLYKTRLLGARLNGALLQAANLTEAQLQGADLGNAHLQAAQLANVSVWRARIEGADTTDALVSDPDTAVLTSKEYELIEEQLDHLSGSVFVRIELLDSNSKRVDDTFESSGARWAYLAKTSPSLEVYKKALAQMLQTLGCIGDGAPYVVNGLARQLSSRFPYGSPYPAAIAATFLDTANCPGARGLSQQDSAALQRLVGTALTKP